MPGIDIGVTDVAAAAGVFGVAAELIPSASQVTTTTADPGTSGASLAILSAAKFPASNGFFVRVWDAITDEYMFVTGGAGSSPFAVTRNVNPPSTASAGAGVAHAVGSNVSLMVAAQQVIPIPDRVTTFDGTAAGFRTLGTAATPQNLFSIENQAGSQVILAIKRLSVEMDATAVLTAVAPEFLTTRPTALPTGGTALTKGGTDPNQTSDSHVVLRSATASDGGAATAITATAGSARLWHQFQMRLHTAVGQVLTPDMFVLPEYAMDDPFLIRPGGALLLQIIGTAASNLATNHYVPKIAWEEFRMP